MATLGIRLVIVWSLAWGMVLCVPAIERAAVVGTALSLASLLSMMAVPVLVSGSAVAALGVSVVIVPDCTSLTPTLLLAGAMVAYPAPWRWRLLGVMLGTTVLWAYNLGRVAMLMLVLAWGRRWFDLMHVYLWQSVTLILVTAAFVLWQRLPTSRAS